MRLILKGLQGVEGKGMDGSDRQLDVISVKERLFQQADLER